MIFTITYKNTDIAYGKRLVKKRRIIPHALPVYAIGSNEPVDIVQGMPEIEEYEEYE